MHLQIEPCFLKNIDVRAVCKAVRSVRSDVWPIAKKRDVIRGVFVAQCLILSSIRFRCFLNFLGCQGLITYRKFSASTASRWLRVGSCVHTGDLSRTQHPFLQPERTAHVRRGIPNHPNRQVTSGLTGHLSGQHANVARCNFIR